MPINESTAEATELLPPVAILILNWEGWRDTIECLESVFRLDYPDFRVVVCDNDSRDDSFERIKDWATEQAIGFVELDSDQVRNGEGESGGDTPLVLIRVRDNLGFAGGNNVGLGFVLQQPDLRFVWLLNNDAVADGAALRAMVRTAEARERVGIVGSKVLHYDQPDTIQAIGGGRVIPWTGMTEQLGRGELDAGQWCEPLRPDYVTGSSMLVRIEMIREIGLMDERYFLYSEEVDWCVRARRQGWDLLYCPESVVWHKEGGTTGPRSPLSDYYSVRSILLFTEKFYPRLLPLAFLHSVFRCLLPKLVRLQFARGRAVTQAYRDFLRIRRTGAAPDRRPRAAAEARS